MGKIIHGLVVSILGYLVIICLFLLANAAVFAQITANRTEVKVILSNSGVYDRVAPALLDSLAKQNQSASLPLDDPEVKKIAKESFDRRSIQINIESAIDGTYDWLEGKTEQLQFNLDLKSAKDGFSDGLSNYLLARIEKLPPCNLAELRQLQSNPDILSLQCAPPQINRSLINAEVDKALASQGSLLADQTITPTDIKDQNGQPALDRIKDLPEAFQAAKSLPWLLGLIGVIAAAGLFFMSQTRAQALKRLGITFLAAGILLLLVPTIADIYADTVFKNIAGRAPLLSELAYPALQTFNARAAGIYYGFGIFATLIGIGLLIFRWRMLKRNL